MADIQLRFHHDMLVLSAPLDYALARQGVHLQDDYEFSSILEPELVQDALRLEVLAGAQCLVAATGGICSARLAHTCMETRGSEIAAALIAGAQAHHPQHILCEIGPCGLPLDPSSAISLKQSRAQYEGAARALGTGGFDGILLAGMRGPVDMRCAIEGVRTVFSGPLFAVLDIDEGVGVDEVCSCMRDKGGADCLCADVVGIQSARSLKDLCEAVRTLATLTDAPILVQIRVSAPTQVQKRRASLGGPADANPYFLPDNLADAALALRAAGAQFLRACGEATPAYTGALSVATMGLDCLR